MISQQRSWLILALMIVGTIIGGVWHLVATRREQDHLVTLRREIENWGGEVLTQRKSSTIYDPIRPLLGSEIVHSLAGFEGYHLQGPMNREASREQLRKLHEFRPLLSFDAMNGSKIDDDWVGAIPDPQSAQNLVLGGTSITDRSVPNFLKMSHLHHLCVDHTTITDEGVARLLTLPSLTRLEIGGRTFQGIRLLEVTAEKLEAKATGTGGPGGQISGRLAIDERLGEPIQGEIMTSQSVGSKAFGGRVQFSKDRERGAYRFEISLSGLPTGQSQGRLEITTQPPGQSIAVFCRLRIDSIELPVSPNP